MPHRIEVVNSQPYVVSPDDPPPLGHRLWALVRARVVDELTDQPVLSAIILESDAAFASPRVASDGLVGLVGIPQQVFPPLAAHNYTVRLTVRAVGYLPRQVSVAIQHDQRTLAAPAPALHDTVMTLDDTARLSVGDMLLVGPVGADLDITQIQALGPGAQQVTLTTGLLHSHGIGDPVIPVVPDDFAPTDLGVLAMHRQSVVIRGRTVQAIGNTTTPLPGATVQVTGIWRTLPPANMSVPPEPPNLVALQPPLYAERAAVVGRLQRRNLQPVVGDDKLLLDDVLADANLVRLSNHQNLTPGDLVVIDATNPDLAEYLAISAINGASTATQPARITLDHPLAYAHRRNAIVQRANPQALGAQKQLVHEALAGDTCIFLNNLTGLATAREVRLTGGPQAPEYHRVYRFIVTSDSDGYYRLPPVSRVAQLLLHAAHGGLTPVESAFCPDYTQRENRCDFMFR